MLSTCWFYLSCLYLSMKQQMKSWARFTVKLPAAINFRKPHIQLPWSRRKCRLSYTKDRVIQELTLHSPRSLSPRLPASQASTLGHPGALCSSYLPRESGADSHPHHFLCLWTGTVGGEWSDFLLQDSMPRDGEAQNLEVVSTALQCFVRSSLLLPVIA